MRSIPSRFALALATAFLGVTLSLSSALAANKPQAFTGKVSDAMCGANHMMAGDAAECTRACIRKGSKYALVVGDKVYALDASDQAALDQLTTGPPAGQSHRRRRWRYHHRTRHRRSQVRLPPPEVFTSTRRRGFFPNYLDFHIVRRNPLCYVLANLPKVLPEETRIV